MLRLSDSVVVLDCPALVAGSYTGHVPVRAAPVELPYQATTGAVQAADDAGQPDSATGSPGPAATQATLHCKRKRRTRLAEDQATVNAGEAAANRRHAAIQPVLQSAIAVFQAWLSKQDVQRLTDALRDSNALPPVTAASGAAVPGPACTAPAPPFKPSQPAAGSAGTPARESDLDLLALAELRAVLKPKFRFLAPAGAPELPGQALAEARAASGAARRGVPRGSSPLALSACSAASTASGARHCSDCLSSQVPPHAAPRSPAQACAEASACARADEQAGAAGSAQGCNLFDMLIRNASDEERKALAFQTHVLVPPRARFLLSDVTRLRPLLPSAPAALCGA